MKTHKAKKCVFTITCDTATSSEVANRSQEASRIIPTSEMISQSDSLKSLIGTTKTSVTLTNVPAAVCDSQVPLRDPIPGTNFESVTELFVSEPPSSELCMFSLISYLMP